MQPVYVCFGVPNMSREVFWITGGVAILVSWSSFPSLPNHGQAFQPRIPEDPGCAEGRRPVYYDVSFSLPCGCPLHFNIFNPISFVLLGRLIWPPQTLVDINAEDHFRRQPWGSSPGETFHITRDSHLLPQFILQNGFGNWGHFDWPPGQCDPWELPYGWYFLLPCQCCEKIRSSAWHLDPKMFFWWKKCCNTKMLFLRTLFSILVPMSCAPPVQASEFWTLMDEPLQALGRGWIWNSLQLFGVSEKNWALSLGCWYNLHTFF